MLVRRVAATLVGLTVLLAAEAATAQWLTAIPRAIVRDFNQRNRWPEQYVCADREAVRAPFDLMVVKGWMRQNTLGTHHFEPHSGELTEAGRLKVQWIVFEAPAQHRNIFVHRSPDAQETAARLAATGEYATGISVEGAGPPPVLLSDTAPSGWPAERVDTIGRKFQASLPQPVLPAPQSDY
jgi:hypothetical protein